MATETKRKKRPQGDVLDLAEAAAYLRLPEDAVIEAMRDQQLPGRVIRGEWRFLKSAIQEWLRVGPTTDFWVSQFGALKDDPFLEQMLQQIYRDRGRSMTG